MIEKILIKWACVAAGLIAYKIGLIYNQSLISAVIAAVVVTGIIIVLQKVEDSLTQ